MHGQDRFVVDSCALFSYFRDDLSAVNSMSNKALCIIDNVFNKSGHSVLIIPSVVFIELFDKFVRDEKRRAMIYYEIIVRIINNGNIEIRPIDFEVLEQFERLGSVGISFENRDRIILATALSLDTYILSSDSKILEYFKSINKPHRVLI